MPYDIQITDKLIKVTFHGRISVQELSRYADELARVEAQSPISLNRLSDITGIEGVATTGGEDLDFNRLDAFAAKRRTAPLKNPVKSAIIAQRDVHFGCARMFQVLNTNPLIEVQVFRTAAEAIQWLETPVKPR